MLLHAAADPVVDRDGLLLFAVAISLLLLFAAAVSDCSYLLCVAILPLLLKSNSSVPLLLMNPLLLLLMPLILNYDKSIDAADQFFARRQSAIDLLISSLCCQSQESKTNRSSAPLKNRVGYMLVGSVIESSLWDRP